jgi:hypothetical protein
VLLAAVLGASGLLPAAVGWSALAAAILLLAVIVGINHDFYAFFARVKGFCFALAVAPFHVLYYLYSGVALAAGIVLHLLNRPAKGHASAAVPAAPIERSVDAP